MPHPPPRTRPEHRAAELIRLLELQAHPEGGHYREIYRASTQVQPQDTRLLRSALTSIDFLLTRGEFSAWHRVASDEAWHLLEGDGLRLWLMPPDLGGIECIDLGAVTEGRAPRRVVPAGCWQAAEPLGDYALVGATVGPGFDFTDFSFLRGDTAACAALQALNPDLMRLL